MEPNWPALQALLIAASETAIERFLASIGTRKLKAIGYVFELGNLSPQFDICANNSSDNHGARNVVCDERWNSGDYAYPAGLLNSSTELGDEWNIAYGKLHEHANDERYFDAVYAGLIRIASQTLVTLATRGRIPNPTELDYNVSEVGDSLELVESRHLLILNAIKNVG